MDFKVHLVKNLTHFVSGPDHVRDLWELIATALF